MEIYDSLHIKSRRKKTNPVLIHKKQIQFLCSTGCEKKIKFLKQERSIWIMPFNSTKNLELLIRI